MRLGVLDVGSNTVHLLVVDAHRGAQPTPQHTRKSVLRLWEHIRKRGDLDLAGADALVGAALGAVREAKELSCDDLLAFATSAVRDAQNSAEVLDRVRDGDRRRSAGAVRRGRGPADLPGRSAVVRLERRHADLPRHRRRLAGVGGRAGRAAGVALSVPLGAGSAHPGVVQR